MNMLNVFETPKQPVPQMPVQTRDNIPDIQTEFSRWPYNLLDAISENGIWDKPLTDAQTSGLEEAVSRIPDEVAKCAMLCIFRDNHTPAELAEAWNITPERAKDLAWQAVKYIRSTPLCNLIKWGPEQFSRMQQVHEKEKELKERELECLKKDRYLSEKYEELLARELTVKELEKSLELRHKEAMALEADAMARLSMWRRLQRKCRRHKDALPAENAHITASVESFMRMPVSALNIDDSLLGFILRAGFGTIGGLCLHLKKYGTLTNLDRIGVVKEKAILDAVKDLYFSISGVINNYPVK